jgi:hypothetical protein
MDNKQVDQEEQEYVQEQQEHVLGQNQSQSHQKR